MGQETEKTKVVFLENGPIVITGVADLSGQYGEKATEGSIYVCRCGQSKNKPYCDGSHRVVEFKG